METADNAANTILEKLSMISLLNDSMRGRRNKILYSGNH